MVVLKVLCPDYLVKEELKFELLALGENPSSDVATMRSTYREAVKKGNEGKWPKGIAAKDVGEYCKHNFELISLEAVGWRDEQPVGREKVKIMTRVSHLHNKLLLLKSILEKPEEVSWVEGALNELLEILAFMTESGKSSKMLTKVDQGLESANTAKVDVIEESVPEKRDGAEASSLGERSSLLPSISEGNQIGNDFLLDHASRTFPLSRFENLGSLPYAKLPNPVLPMLQNLGSIDGLDPISLIDFLGKTMSILDVPGVDDHSLLQMLIPYCRPPLVDRLYDVLRSKGDFSSFHRIVLDFFIPGRLVEQLKAERVYRVQYPGEELANFVTEVKRACRVLRLKLSENEIVGIVLDGLAPEERSRLCLQAF